MFKNIENILHIVLLNYPKSSVNITTVLCTKSSLIRITSNKITAIY